MSEIKEEDVKKLYDQLRISQKSNNLNEYPFFNSKDEYLAWKPLIV